MERYYDHNDILNENIENVIFYVNNFINTHKLYTIMRHLDDDRIPYIAEQFHQILYLLVKRDSLFSKETLAHKVQVKVNSYKEAHKAKEIDVFHIFGSMYTSYASLAANVCGVEYNKLPKRLQSAIEYQLYVAIGITE